MAHMIIDVETAGPFGKSLVYDLGIAVVNDKGELLATRSWIIEDVFYGMPRKMATAYYADKIPMYNVEIVKGKHRVITFLEAYEEFAALCKFFNIRKVWAFNAKFDRDALNYTISYISRGFVTDFFPAGVKVACIMGAAISTVCNCRKYADFAERSDKGNIRVGAEQVYRYLTNNAEFDEAHTGLADALIESEILLACLRRHAKMDTEPKQTTAFPAWRELQKRYAL